VVRTSIAVALALLAMACESHPGRVLVVVDTDYRVPAELSEVRILAGPADDPEDRTGQGFVLTRITPPPPGTYRLPLSMVVVPRGGDSDRRVEIVVEGRAAATGDVLIRSTRILDGFRRGDTIVLPIFLSTLCETMICETGRTCVNGACESVEIDPGTLRIAEDPGEEFRSLPDTGTPPDAALDAAVDAMDSEVDTSMVDSGPVDASDDISVDAGICGPPVTLPYLVVTGDSTLYPMTPGPGMWTYNEPNWRRTDTEVEWTHTARPGCEIYRVEPSIPDGMPQDATVACSGTCATRATWGALYEVHLDGATGTDEIIQVDQSIAVDRVRLDLTNPAETVTIVLSDLTNEFAMRNESYVVFHDATFYSRPAP
jgi:hypothetical protein